MIHPPPVFDTRSLSEPEEYEAGHLWDLLDELAQFTLDFEAALDLLDVAERMHRDVFAGDPEWGPATQAGRWPFVPARDAAVSLYQFGWTLTTSIPDALRRCPTLMAKLDTTALREIRRQFQDAFSTHHLLRHAVGHSAELAQTREHIAKNAATSKQFGGRLFQRGKLLNRTLSYTIKGTEASVAITRETLAVMKRLTTETFDAFAPISWQRAP